MTAVPQSPILSALRVAPACPALASQRFYQEPAPATSSDTSATWISPSETVATTSVSEPRNGVIRWYDPITGRWLSNDPIGISGGLNQYVFCDSNPVNYRDPFGLCKGESTSWLDDIATRWGLTWRAVRYGEWRALGNDFDRQLREMNRRAEEDPYGFALSFATGGTTVLGKGLGDALSKGGFKLLSDGEIGKLIRNDLHPHSLKPKPHSRYDLYKDPKGNIHVFPKGGQGPGDPTGININDL